MMKKFNIKCLSTQNLEKDKERERESARERMSTRGIHLSGKYSECGDVYS